MAAYVQDYRLTTVINRHQELRPWKLTVWDRDANALFHCLNRAIHVAAPH